MDLSAIVSERRIAGGAVTASPHPPVELLARPLAMSLSDLAQAYLNVKCSTPDLISQLLNGYLPGVDLLVVALQMRSVGLVQGAQAAALASATYAAARVELVLPRACAMLNAPSIEAAVKARAAAWLRLYVGVTSGPLVVASFAQALGAMLPPAAPRGPTELARCGVCAEPTVELALCLESKCASRQHTTLISPVTFDAVRTVGTGDDEQSATVAVVCSLCGFADSLKDVEPRPNCIICNGLLES